MSPLNHILGLKIKRKRRGVLLLVCSFLCLILIVTVMVYEVERNRLTGKILGVLGRDLNTTAKVLPISIDTTLLQPSHGCQFSGKNALAVIVVPSVPRNRKNRERIRTTWGKYRFQESIFLFFMVGKSSHGNITALRKEAETHGDIIIDDLEENYYALSIKILRALKWFVNNCPAAKFLIKVDEDVVLNLPQFALQLRTWPEEYHLGGYIISDGAPHLWNPFTKWFVPRELWQGGSLAPAYLEGPCYVIRGDVVQTLLETSYDTPMYHLEDVLITGFIANERLKLNMLNFKGVVKQNYLYLWYLWQYFFHTCNFTSVHTDQDYSLFIKIVRWCEEVLY